MFIKESISCSFAIIGLITFSFFAHSCEKDEVSGPSNLNLSITIQGAVENNPNGDGSGVIHCSASATDAVKYGFKFGTAGEEIESVSGNLDFTYTNEGTNSYTVFVFAYSSTGNSISTYENIAVFVDDQIQLVWSDEFNTNGAPDSTKWGYDIGGDGWGNGESQYYTNRSDNVIVEDGVLKIIAKSNGSGGYTSARIKSENLFKFTYGTVEVRAKLPAAQGTWPAIWMLGANFNSVGWPTCGEIDIMEQKGWDKNKVLGTCHWSNNGNYAGYGLETTVANASGNFHVYKLEWTEGDAIRFFVDNLQYFVISTNNSMPFNKDFFFILNVAMGGNLGGDIDPTFTEDTMEIDYIRVYQ